MLIGEESQQNTKKKPKIDLLHFPEPKEEGSKSSLDLGPTSISKPKEESIQEEGKRHNVLTFRGQNTNKIAEKVKAEIESTTTQGNPYINTLDKSNTLPTLYLLFAVLTVLEFIKYFTGFMV